MDEFEQGDAAGSAPAQSSITAPLLRALLFAALAFGIYALLFGGDDLDGTALVDEGATPVPAVTLPATPATVAPLDALPTATPEPTPLGSAVPLATEAPTEGAGTVGQGVTVQVIAGAGTTGQQFDDAVAALRDMGYEVTESGISPNAYPTTTVFATAGEEAQAEALVASDPRFTSVEDNPGNLTDQIQIHVLVGEDWPT